MRHHLPPTISLTRPKGRGQRQVGSLAGAARPRKDIEGAQRSPHPGQKPGVEGKAKRGPDGVLDNKGPRGESRA